MTDNQVIPEAAVTAAAKALFADKMSNHSGDNAPQIIDACEKVARKILEAAAPHMLSHEQEETRLAHVDAVVNAESIGKYEAAVEQVRELHTMEYAVVPAWQYSIKSEGAICGLDNQRWPCETVAAIDEALK